MFASVGVFNFPTFLFMFLYYSYVLLVIQVDKAARRIKEVQKFLNIYNALLITIILHFPVVMEHTIVTLN